MNELSTQIELYIDAVVEEYGLKCVKFSLVDLDIDISKYDVINESQIAAITKGNLTRGDKTTINILSEDCGHQHTISILGDLARNPEADGADAMSADMSMGMASGSVFENKANQMFAPMDQQQTQSVQQPMPQPAQPVSFGRFVSKGQLG